MTETKSPVLFLKPGREKSVRSLHPWIFSGAMERISGNAGMGDTVEVCSAKGDWLCRAAYSPRSNIRARIWTWDKNQSVDEEFFADRVQKAAALRDELRIAETTEMYRLIHAESDGLPGLIVDRYKDVLVAQFLTAGAEAWKPIILKVLSTIEGVRCIYERSDADVRQLEGLPEQTGVLSGSLPDQPMLLSENGLRFKVNVADGHKTGFYLDQRENRKIFREMAAGGHVLNCFCYTGAFGVYGLAGRVDGQADGFANGNAVRITSVDSSAQALELARQNMQLNGFPLDQHTFIEGDVFQVLRQFRDQAKQFDAIILDPPRFAPTSAQVERAARGYKDINLLAFKLLRPGGLLFTFSCSGGVSMELFQKIVASAAEDARVQASILRRMYNGPDHPIRLSFPEGAYLKGLVCKVLE
ncbi:MAG: class I SAM-dependent rRNA methyltransferase [Chloroflexi bacterium]|nr:class I SAM-dependent rRNA methyltransferase [Chloroflexota bacterium]